MGGKDVIKRRQGRKKFLTILYVFIFFINNSWGRGGGRIDLSAIMTRRNQSIKIDTDLSIDKSVKIVRIDLIDIDQSVEINNTRVFFIDCR